MEIKEKTRKQNKARYSATDALRMAVQWVAEIIFKPGLLIKRIGQKKKQR
ncbi:hypothetical protein M1N57_00305 [Dehalococcoidales bacterium]|nr:hypothetical protein [Dehalococcoidales bacterium]